MDFALDSSEQQTLQVAIAAAVVACSARLHLIFSETSEKVRTSNIFMHKIVTL
jgi:hypothetical protein